MAKHDMTKMGTSNSDDGGSMDMGMLVSIMGVTWLVRNVGNFTPPSIWNPCPNCGKGTQAELAELSLLRHGIELKNHWPIEK